MKRIFVLIFVFVAAINLSAQTSHLSEVKEFEKHNFGIGIGYSTFPIVSDYSSANIGSGSMYDMTNAFIFNVSIQYDHAFSKHFSLSIQPTYINQYIEFKDVTTPSQGIYTSRTNSLYFHQLSIPLFINYRFKLVDNVNFMSSIGIGGIINLQKEKGFGLGNGETFVLNGVTNYSLYKTVTLNVDNSFTPEVLLRAGLEINTKRKMQVLLTYSFSPEKNYYFKELDFCYKTNNFRVTMLELGFNIFL